VKYVVVIPAYNEGATIRSLVERCLLLVPDVIVVDDGSTDNTCDALAGLDVTLLKNKVNLGKAGSLLHGIQHACNQFAADVAITLDGDGQHRPEDIPMLCSIYDSLHDSSSEHIVIAARLVNQHKAPKARLYANKFADFWVSWAAGQRIYDTQSGFRLYPVSLLNNIDVSHDKNHSFVFESELLIEAVRNGYRCVSAPIESIYLHDSRPSHFRPVEDIARIVFMVAWKLFTRGFYVQGLIRVLTDKKSSVCVSEKAQIDSAQ